MTCPVRKLAFGEAQNTTPAATSSARPRRSKGVVCTTDAMHPSPAALVISVSILPGLVPCCITHVLPVRWLHDGTGVVDQYVNTPSLCNAVLNEASSIPTTGEIHLHRHCLDSLVKNRINRLQCSGFGVEGVHRAVRTLFARTLAISLPLLCSEPVTRALRPATLFSGLSRPRGLAYDPRFMLPPPLTNNPYKVASTSTNSLALTTVPCRRNTFSISSLWTSGSRSAHPSSTTMRW